MQFKNNLAAKCRDEAKLLRAIKQIESKDKKSTTPLKVRLGKYLSIKTATVLELKDAGICLRHSGTTSTNST